MKDTDFTHISLTIWLMLSGFAASAAPFTTSLQVPFAGTVIVPLRDGTNDTVP